MKALPFGVPKLLISSVAAMPAYAGRLSEYFGLRDITVMHTVVDTVGMNSLIETLAVNGANAVSGMVEVPPDGVRGEEADHCADRVRLLREGRLLCEGAPGKRVRDRLLSCHGFGRQGRRGACKPGSFSAFVDLVPASFSEYLFGGNRASGPNRLDAARDLHIPYVLSPCGFDMISCGPIERKDKKDPLWESRKLAERKLLLQDAIRVQARTSTVEMEEVALGVAEKLGRYRHKEMVKVVIPRKGFSSLGVEGAALHDPESDEAFVGALKRHIHPEIEVREVDADINSREFAWAAVDALSQALLAKGQAAV